MTNEEMERAITFLLESQAKHDAQIAGLGQMIGETNRAVQMMAASQREVNEMLTRAVADLIESQRQTQAQLRDTDARLRETDGRLRDTDARLRDTDARLNVVVNVVERLAGRE